MNTQLGPRARAIFDALEQQPMPKDRCSHLRDDASLRTRVLVARATNMVRCPTCLADYVHAVVTRSQSNAVASTVFKSVGDVAHHLYCDACHQQIDVLTPGAWTPVHRDSGALTLVAYVCRSCVLADEADLERGSVPAPRHSAAIPTFQFGATP